LVLYYGPKSLYFKSWLTLLAGFLWGPIKRALLALTGATLGATLSFQLSRYFFKDTLRARLGYERWKYLDELTKNTAGRPLPLQGSFPFFLFQ